jgi:hypothetical protein
MMFCAALFITALLVIPTLLAATIDILLGPPVLLTTLVLFSFFLNGLGENNERHYLQHYE